MDCGLCQSLGCAQLFVTPRTVARQASLSMQFSRQEYWSGLLFPEELPSPGIEHGSPTSQADSLPFELQGSLRGSMSWRQTAWDQSSPLILPILSPKHSLLVAHSWGPHLPNNIGFLLLLG